MVDFKVWDDYARTKSVDIRNQIIVNYRDCVKYTVNKAMKKKPDGITREDLLQIGFFGLMDAVEKFDYKNTEAKFETYAEYRIYGKIMDEIRRYISVNGGSTRTMLAKMKRIEQAIQAVESREGRNATIDEIASELQISKDAYYKMLSDITQYVPLSLDKVLGDNESSTVLDVVPDKQAESPDYSYVKKERYEKLIKEMDDLPPREYRVMISYYYEDLSFREIAYQLNVTPGRVSQLHANAIIRLKSKFEGE